MSDIWTPGSPPPGDGGNPGGIELPKGFARRRDEPKKEESEAPAETTSAETESEPTPTGGPLDQLLFPPQGARIQCPSCSTPFVTPVFSIIDLGVNPELREPLLGGQVNTAVCTNCGAGGALSAPLMVHDPENEFLGVLVPGGSAMGDVQGQKVIGEMTQALMSKLSTEKRRGYMLQPQQFFSWDSLLEKLWGFEGVTPEMLRLQRDQSELISNLMRLGQDTKAMKLAVERRKHLVDRNFFALLGQLINALASQGQSDEQQALMDVRTHLLETTEVGGEVKALEGKLQEALDRISPDMSQDEFLDVLLEYWRKGEDGESIVTTLLASTRGVVDYQFLMMLSERIDRTDDPEDRGDLISLRDRIVEMSQQQSQGQEAQIEQAQSFLQDVLQSSDPEAVLRERIDEVDELFLAILNQNVENAEEQNATFAAQRLRTIYEQALSIVSERLPPDLQLLNQLIAAPDDAAIRNILSENRETLSREFVDALQELEGRFRDEGRPELAKRLQSIRSQAALML